MDIDKIFEGEYAGCYLVADGMGSIKILNLSTREIVWETDECEFFVHGAEMMPGGESLIVADTNADRAFEINLTTKEVVWDWYLYNATADSYCWYLNWTAFGLQHGWNEKAFDILADYPRSGNDYSHLNSVQFINGSLFGRTYDSILISLRNFDMVVEVNYTAKDPTDPAYMNITWHYGMPGDHSILYHQHDAIRWPNGHTTISDSTNRRIIELDESNQVVLVYKSNLRWNRGCEILPNGNYLITDSNNKRIIEVNITTGVIVKTFSDLLINPYEADYIAEDNQVIVGDTISQMIVIYDYETGKVVDALGFPSIVATLDFLFIIVITYVSIDLGLQWRAMKGLPLKERFKAHSIFSKFILLGISFLSIVWCNYIILFVWQMYYQG